MKIKKGSIAIYVFALMLVTAGYWNYISKESQTIETVSMSQNNENQQNEQNNEQSDEHLGDAALVSNNELINEENQKTQENLQQKDTENQESNQQTSEQDSYFEESKLSRDTMYSQTLETYQGILNNSNVSEEQKSVVTQQIAELNKEKNAIMICENLISAKGFDKCVVFVNVDSISVIIGRDELKADEIAQIQNIISREMGAEVQNIHIMTK